MRTATGQCDSCELLRINGIVTHETGCPEAWRDYSRECEWCGSDFRPTEAHQQCCEHSCDVAYHNYQCNCAECSINYMDQQYGKNQWT